jgi:NADPH:quinone reductase-like Zn-dependent oxidoreductase
MVAGDRVASMVQVVVPPFSSKAVLGKPTAARLQAVIDAVAAGDVKVAIAARFPLERAEEAHALSQTGRVTGKIILEP